MQKTRSLVYERDSSENLLGFICYASFTCQVLKPKDKVSVNKRNKGQMRNIVLVKSSFGFFSKMLQKSPNELFLANPTELCCNCSNQRINVNFVMGKFENVLKSKLSLKHTSKPANQQPPLLGPCIPPSPLLHPTLLFPEKTTHSSLSHFPFTLCSIVH